MNAVLASLIAVTGTLLRSLSTYLFQRRTALGAETVARGERLRQEQLAACGGFAAGINELKRGVIASWLKRDRDSGSLLETLAESDRLGAAAETAWFRMLLVTDDSKVRELAEAAFVGVGSVGESADRAELREGEKELEAAVLEFIAAGRFLG